MSVGLSLRAAGRVRPARQPGFCRVEPLEARALLSASPAAENAPPAARGIPDVAVDEDAPDTVIDLRAAFDDDADPDDALVFSIHSTTSTSLFRALTINPAAGTLTLAYARDTSGSASIVVRAADTQGAATLDAFSVTVRAVNDAPVNRVPGPQATTAGTPLFLGQRPNFTAVSDVDLGPGNLTVTLGVAGMGGADAGTLTIGKTTGLQFHQGDGEADAVVSFSGTGRAILTALSGLRYDPAPGFTGAATLTMTSDDQCNTGAGGSLTDTDTVEVQVVAPPRISVADARVVEGDEGTAAANVTVSLSAAHPLPVRVRWGTADGTARASGTAVPNGGFEEPAIGGGWSWFPAGTTIGPWVVGSGSVDVVSMWQDAEGAQSIDLSGSGAGAIYQDLPTEPGRTYTLRFALAGNPEVRGEDRIKRVSVDFGDAAVDTLSFDTTGRTLEDMGWGYHSYSVTATSATTRLRFTSLNELSDTGPAIDDVKLLSAEGDDDYNAAAGFLQFAPGETTKTVSVLVHGDTKVEPDETFFVNLSEPEGATVETGRATVTIVNDDEPPAPPPRVAGVFVSAAHWTQALKDHLAAGGLGSGLAGFGVPAGAGDGGRLAQLAALPWLGVTEVSVRFDSDVLVARDDLVVGVVADHGYPVEAFSYDRDSRTATWRLSTPLRADRLRLDLDADDGEGVRTAGVGRAALDGEWDNDPEADPPETYPSGDGTAGGDFLFRLDALPGDVTGDGRVDALDLADVKRRLARRAGDGATGDSAYSVFADVTGDAVISALDVAAVKQRLARALPAPQPAAAPPPAPPAVARDVQRVSELLFGATPL